MSLSQVVRRKNSVRTKGRLRFCWSSQESSAVDVTGVDEVTTGLRETGMASAWACQRDVVSAMPWR